MSAPIIWSGNDAKTLKSIIDINGQAKILSGSVDPTSSATSAPKGSIYLNTSTGLTYRKLDSGSSTNWLVLSSSSSGDILETIFSAANNTASQDITGFAFSTSTIRSFEAQVSISIDATSDLFEVYTLRGVYRNSAWDMSQTSNGDDSLATFNITNAGQVQVSTGNYTGFVSATIKFRATVLQQ